MHLASIPVFQMSKPTIYRTQTKIIFPEKLSGDFCCEMMAIYKVRRDFYRSNRLSC